MAAAPLKHIWSVAVFLVALLLSSATLSAAELKQPSRDPEIVLKAYLRATYARDFADAYRYISTADRKIRDLDRYVQQRGSFNGFALEISRKLSEAIAFELARRDENPYRIQFVAKYQVPDPKKLASWLLNWDAYRLNSSSAAERKQILDRIEKSTQSASLPMSAGEETFELVRENGEWRVFLNWAAGVKIPFRLDLSKSADLDVSLSKTEIVIQPGDLFEIVLRIKNRTDQPLAARIGHLVEPTHVADFLDFVQCGFLLPVTIAPGKEEQFSGTYLLRGSLPEGVRQLSLTYDFRLLK